MKQKKRNFKVGDKVYFITPNGVEYDNIMIIDDQELTLSDYSCIYKRDCLNEDDPRIKDAKPSKPSMPPEDVLKEQEEILRKQGLL